MPVFALDWDIGDSEGTMRTPERRHPVPVGTNLMRDQLNDAQREVLRMLERFGWELRFVRRPLFQPAVAVVCDNDATWALIRDDGSVDERTKLEIRHDARAQPALPDHRRRVHRPASA